MESKNVKDKSFITYYYRYTLRYDGYSNRNVEYNNDDSTVSDIKSVI